MVLIRDGYYNARSEFEREKTVLLTKEVVLIILSEFGKVMNSSLTVPNFRDVGQTINVIAESEIMKTGTLFRGGKLSLVKDLSLIHQPQTIINLREGKDPEFEGVVNFQLPEPNNSDVYNANDKKIRNWIGAALNLVASPDSEPPFLIHCAAGKDRTGVIVAAVLMAIDIPRTLISQEYHLSVGGLKPKLFSKTLDSLQNEKFYKSINIGALKSLLLA